MNQEIIHVYLMPGMAANSTIFEFIDLPKEQFEIHWLDWFIPKPKQTLQDYAKEMCAKIEYENSVLLGVSFGGILVQEMAKIKQFLKVIVVSSIKSKHELPKRLKVAKYTKAYKLLPTQLLSSIDVLAKYSFGETITKRIELYKKYLSITDKHYINWSIEQIIFWDQETPNPDTIFIHGDKDMVFPHSCQGNCLVIKGGSHIMIINRFKWFNENLPKIILNKK